MFKVGDKVIVDKSWSGLENRPMHGTVEFIREIEGINLYYVSIDEYHGNQIPLNEHDLTLMS